MACYKANGEYAAYQQQKSLVQLGTPHLDEPTKREWEYGSRMEQATGDWLPCKSLEA